ncbi:hypothetical protein WIW90_04240 [Sulfolobaceae archaeon RB850M]|jgi:hypothetical protein|nr:hypothetical protein [Sulfolobaceae archaeon]
MSDVIDYSNSESLLHELKIGEAVAHIVAAASIVEELEGESEEVRETVRKYVDAWISALVPIDYVPGMAEVIGSKISKKLTQIFDEVSEKELGETLDLVIEAKRELEEGNLPYYYKEVEVRVERILRALGIDLSYVYKFLDGNTNNRLLRLISILAVSIGIASVWDPKWTVESQ